MSQVTKLIAQAKQTLVFFSDTAEPSHSFFNAMWLLQKDFLSILIAKKKMIKFPVEMSKKENQQVVRDLLRDAADELHEACLTLKNSKSHKTTEENVFDRDHFIEEIVDSIKFCLGALLYANVTPDEFMKIFIQKSKININRQESGY